MARLSRTVRAAVLLGDSSRYAAVLGALLLTIITVVYLSLTEWTAPAFDRVVTGTTTSRVYTAHREWTVESRRTRIYAMDATFRVDGVPHSVRSYSSADLPEGTPVEIEYVASDPAKARIKSMRAKPYAPFSLSMWFLVSVTLVSVVFAVRLLRSAFRSLSILARGVVGTARIINVDRSLARMGVRGAWRASQSTVHCEIELPEGRKVRTSIVAFGSVRETVDATVVYDPAAPEQATILSTLPGNLAAHADGRIMTMRSNATIWGLVVLGIAFAIAEVAIIVAI